MQPTKVAVSTRVDKVGEDDSGVIEPITKMKGGYRMTVEYGGHDDDGVPLVQVIDLSNLPSALIPPFKQDNAEERASEGLEETERQGVMAVFMQIVLNVLCQAVSDW